MVEQVDDQGGGAPPHPHHLTSPFSSDQSWDRGDQDDEITITDHEHFAPRMPSRVDPSDNLPECSNCCSKSSQKSSQHKEMEDAPVSQPSEIFPKCVSQGSSKISILCEVLSWRRTARDSSHQHHQSYHCLSFRYLLVLLSLGSGQLSDLCPPCYSPCQPPATPLCPLSAPCDWTGCWGGVAVVQGAGAGWGGAHVSW